MSIKAMTGGYSEQPTRTQASSYYEQLASRLEGQVKLGVPRSASAWGAEQNRLGSWGTGLGTLQAQGVGPQYQSGVGKPLFNIDPNEIEARRT